MTDQKPQRSELVIHWLLELASSTPDEGKPNHLWSPAETEWFLSQPENILLWSGKDLHTLRDLRKELKRRKRALDSLARFLKLSHAQMMDMIRSGAISLSDGGLSIMLPDEPESAGADSGAVDD